MGNQPSTQFCTELADSIYSNGSEVLFSIPYIFLLILVFLIPTITVLPCYFTLLFKLPSTNPLEKFSSRFRRFFSTFFSLFDISASRNDHVYICIQNPGNYENYENNDNLDGENILNNDSNTNLFIKKSQIKIVKKPKKDGNLYVNLSRETRAIGGFVSIILFIFIIGAFYFIYTSHENFLTESVVVQPSVLPSIVKKNYMHGTISYLPCGDDDIVISMAQGIDPHEYNLVNSKTTHYGTHCKVAFNVELFGDAVPTEYKVYFRVTKWKPYQTSSEASNNIEIKFQSATYKIDDEYQFPTGESAFVFMDSCRKTHVDPTKKTVIVHGSMAVRSRCQKIIGSALVCFEDNLSYSHFDVVGTVEGADPLIQIELPLGSIKLDSTFTRKMDSELFVTFMVGIISFFVLQPIFKQLIVRLILVIIERSTNGKSFGIVRTLSIYLSSAFLVAFLSFIFFMFVTDVYFEFKKKTPEFIFSNNMWIFGRDAEIVFADIILLIILISFNIIVDWGLIALSLFLLVSNDQFYKFENYFSNESGNYFSKYFPTFGSQDDYENA